MSSLNCEALGLRMDSGGAARQGRALERIPAGSASTSVVSLGLLSQTSNPSTVSSGDCRIAHSQTTPTRQPTPRRARIAAWSRSRLPASFLSQNSARDLGSWKDEQPSCRCQKHPCTNTAARHFGNRRSGFPGSDFECRRKRKPFLQSNRRIASSGFVFVPRIRDISSERFSELITSAIGTGPRT